MSDTNDRIAFLERRISRRKALQYGAAGAAATAATMYASPMVKTAKASTTGLVGQTAVSVEDGTGYGKGPGAECFGNSQWGWSNPVPAVGFPATLQIHVGAGQCETDKGSLVATVTLTNNGDGTATVSAPTFIPPTGYSCNWQIDASEGYHIHTGEDFFDGSFSPGSGTQPDDDGDNWKKVATSLPATFAIDADNDWVIVHGVFECV